VTRIVTLRGADLKAGVPVTVPGQMDEGGALTAGSLSFELQGHD
jgi:hypothetical protein